MKNKLSISLIVVTLSCAFAFVAYAASIESDEDFVSMEMSENEVQSIQEECKDIGVANGVEGEELITFVTECFDANTMVLDEANSEGAELSDEDQEIPAMDDETLTDTEEPVAEDEEPLTESTG